MLVVFEADWDIYGRSAGFRRNQTMARYAAEMDGRLIAFWDGRSKGTEHMIDLAHRYELSVKVVAYGL